MTNSFLEEFNKLSESDKFLLSTAVILIDTNDNKTTDIDKYKQNIHNGRKGKQPKEYMLDTITKELIDYLEVKKLTNKNLSPSNFKTEFLIWFKEGIELNEGERKKINDFIERYKKYIRNPNTSINGETYLKLWNDTIKAPSPYKQWVEKDVLKGQKPDVGTKNIYTINKNKYTQNEIVYGPILKPLFEAIKKVNTSKSYNQISQQISNITSTEKTSDFLFENVPNEINFVTGYSCSKDKYRNMIKDNLLKSVKGDMLESMIIHKSLESSIIKQYNWSLFFNNVVFHGNDKFYDIMKVRRTKENFLAFDKLISLVCKNLQGKETLTSVINSLIDTKNNSYFTEKQLNIPYLLSSLVKCYDMIQPEIPETKEKDKIRKLVERIFTINYDTVSRYETAKELMDIETKNVFPGRVDDIVLIQSKAGPFSLVEDWLNDKKYKNQLDALKYGTELELYNIQTEAVAKDKEGEIRRFKLTPNYQDKKVEITPLKNWYGETYFDFGEDKEQLNNKIKQLQLRPKIKTD